MADEQRQEQEITSQEESQELSPVEIKDNKEASLEKKPKVENSINVQVKSNNKTLKFKIGREMPFKKLMQTFCERSGISKNSVVFLSDDGCHLKDTSTPESLDMEDGCVIEVYSHQAGGY